jgi:hypothetical protein
LQYKPVALAPSAYPLLDHFDSAPTLRWPTCARLFRRSFICRFRRSRS